MGASYFYQILLRLPNPIPDISPITGKTEEEYPVNMHRLNTEIQNQVNLGLDGWSNKGVVIPQRESPG